MKTFVFGALAFCLLAGMIGAAQTAEPFLLKPLDHGAWAAIDNPAAKSQQSGSNAGFVIGSDSVLVVDTFENPPAAQKLLATIRQKTTLPVRFVVNTHYHLDHVAGNGVFAAAGATILGSAECPKLGAHGKPEVLWRQNHCPATILGGGPPPA
jgi:cyclase